MARIALALVVCMGGAAAQLEVTSNNNDLDISRRQSVTAFGLSAAVEAQAAEISELRGLVSTLMGANSPLAITTQAIANQMQSQNTELVSTATANQVRVSSMEAALSAAQSNMALQAAAISQSVSSSVDSIRSEVSVALSSANTSMSRTIASIERSMNASAVAASQQRTQLAAQVDQSLTRMNTSITVSLASKRSVLSHVWSGGCNQGRHGGWHRFCLNQVDVNTARPMFTVVGDQFQALRTGLYDITFGRMFTSCNWEHTAINVNGSRRRHTHAWYWTGGNWMDNEIRLLYTITANQRFWAEAYSACGWTTWHTSRIYSRVTVVYEGNSQ